MEYFEALDLEIYGEMLQHVVPCNTVRKVIVYFSANCRWGDYFAQKYPRLETFILRGRRAEHSEMKAEARRFICSCYCLRSLRFFGGEFYCELIDTLLEIGAPLEGLSVAPMDKPWFMERFHILCKTLTTSHFSGDWKVPFHRLMAQLKICESLTTLSLEKVFSRVEVDSILSEIDDLEKLVLEADSIGLKSKNQYQKTCHVRLKYLTIRGNEIEDEVYQYLSPHCPRLSSIHCHYRSVGYRLPTIYYPNAGLKSLSVWAQPYSSTFKLTRMTEAERIQLQKEGYSKLNELKETKGYTKWFWLSYLAQIESLEPADVEAIIAKLHYKNDGIYKNPEEKGLAKAFQRSFLTSPTILIRCHYLDNITLQGAKIVGC